MKEAAYRNSAGGLIDRDRPLKFYFDNVSYQGFAGDTLASALIANGVHLTGRGFKYHRPRGIYTSGTEEPNALVELREDARREPNTRATLIELYDGLSAMSQNRWPSLAFDILSVNNLLSPFLPAGFYYKTFMWPKQFWEKMYEPFIRRAAGLGRAANKPDPDRYERATLHCDVLVVGAGPAGLVAALAAARSGARVVLAEQDHRVGGHLLSTSTTLDSKSAESWSDDIRTEIEAFEDARLLTRTTVFGYYDHNILAAVERLADHLPVPGAHGARQKLWRIHASRVILACGAFERPLVFGNNDLPGIMLTSAARTYAMRYAARPGSRAVIFTNNSSGYDALADLAAGGVNIVAVIDPRSDIDSQSIAQAEAVGARILNRAVILGARGHLHVRGVDVDAAGVRERIDCDLLCVSGGWNPDVHLHSQTGTRPVWSPDIAGFIPAESRQRELSIGGAAGQFDLANALITARQRGLDAARECGFMSSAFDLPDVAKGSSAYSIEPLWRVAGYHGKALVDMQNDVKETDIGLSAREGYKSVEHLKRYTTLGMATDQGKLSNVNGLGILADELGFSIESVGTTTFRPPVLPVAIGVFAGSSRGQHFSPTRYTPMHDWAVRHGAKFVEAGQWLRPRYYPRDGEDMLAASCRETLATRNSVGLCDVSTLGKIDVQGADAPEFLNRLHSNGFARLPVGKARYGLMLREDGLVLDDGTTTRLAEHHYFMTTTTAEAAAVMAHMEYYHQAIWPQLDVQYCSVTEQWASMAIAGPNSRAVLQKVLTRIDLSNEAFPFLAATEFNLGNFRARLFRISFSGELAYELNVPAGYGESLWQALMNAGKEFGITAYGTEALGIMRIEKGHIAGPEVNGQTTAGDIGLGSMLSSKKEFIGRPLAAREALVDSAREQLVGIRCNDSSMRLYAGAHLVEPDKAAVIENDLGHVTSVTYSPMLKTWIALALLKGGTTNIGKTLKAVNPLMKHEVNVEVVSSQFFDPENTRLHV
ncbi:MAG: sarcosine oxidase subunit alpha [marine bacterium B5-7]|nr:MAG: sarcosine oxidase subunit alpha [marine bacterium B5-7]